MQLYSEIVTDSQDVPIANASVLVQLNGVTATIYSDNGVTPAANPRRTDSTGYFFFYAANGSYTLRVSDGRTARTIPAVLFDAADAGFSASDGSSHIGFIQSGAGAVARTAQDKAREVVSVTDFYANGVSGVAVDPTGAVDSSLGFSAALATGADVRFPPGTYKMATGFTAADHGPQRVFTSGDVTLSVSLAASTDLITINGPLAFENVTFDFNSGPCRYALKYAANVGHIKLSNLKFQNLKDTTTTTGSIPIWIPPTGNTFDVDGIRFSSMLKKGNGIVTDSGGSLNCIYVGGGAGSTQGSIRNIYASDVHNINAADVVIYEDTAVVYVITDSSDTDNLIRIENVQGNEFGKRLLKVHASNVTANGIVGYSTEGDSSGVIGFLSGEGQGDKYGCSATNCRAYGKMENAFSASAFGVKWKNVRAYTTPGTKTGMSNAAFGLLVNGDDTELDGFECGSERHIGIGSAAKIIKNTKLRHLTLYFDATVALGLQNISDTMGFDGLTVDGVRAVVSADLPAGVAVLATDSYLNGTTIKGRNLVVRDVRIESAGPANSYGLNFKYCENVSLDKYRYINTSGLTHYRLAIIESCVNVHVDDVMIEGANAIGVFVYNCTGRSTINRVQNTGATTAAVYNNNSTDVMVNNCDPAKVGGVTTATPQNSKWTVGATADRPTTGLVAGFSQHFDTTLGKPVWLKSTGPSVWVDASGATV